MENKLEKLFNIQKKKANILYLIEEKIKNEGYSNRNTMKVYRKACEASQKATIAVIVELREISGRLIKN